MRSTDGFVVNFLAIGVPAPTLDVLFTVSTSPQHSQPWDPSSILRSRDAESHGRQQRAFGIQTRVRLKHRGAARYWKDRIYVVPIRMWSGHTDVIIHHCPWPLQNVAFDLLENTVGDCAGLRIQGAPSFSSFARELDVLIWPLERLAGM